MDKDKGSDKVTIKKKRVRKKPAPKSNRPQPRALKDEHHGKSSNMTDEFISTTYANNEFNLTLTAKALGMCRTNLYNVMSARPSVAIAMHDAEMRVVDLAVGKLEGLIMEGNLKAIMFFLEKRSKEYSKTVEITGEIKTQVNSVTAKMTPEQAAEIYKGTLKKFNP